MQLKELKWLRYLAYLGMIAAAGIIYIFAPAFGKKMIDGDTVFMPYYWPWIVAIFVIGAVGLFGIFLLTRLFKSVEDVNVFTHENAELFRKMDITVLIALGLSLVVNIYFFVFTPAHHFGFLILWVLFMGFLIFAHLVCRSFYHIVKRSAELKLEVDLVI